MTDVSKKVDEYSRQIRENIKTMIRLRSKKDEEREEVSEKTFRILKQIPQLGDFLAYQIAIDIGYYDKDMYDEDYHVVCGPGAWKGLERLFHLDLLKKDFKSKMAKGEKHLDCHKNPYTYEE